MKRLLIAGFALCLLLRVFEASAQDAVKIGVLADMSGTSVDIGGPGAVVAVELAVADFGGTVAGRKIVVVSADHQSKPDIGSKALTSFSICRFRPLRLRFSVLRHSAKKR
jgi:branched-chain amino acid transport system substrate-binding protein